MRKEYYENNKVKILAKAKIYRESHKVECKARIDKWKQANPERLKELGRKHSGEASKKLREKCLKLIGDKCIFCNSNKRLTFHEIHGIKHISHKNTWKERKYYLEHPKDFISICYKHHGTIHDLSNLNPEQLNNILKYSKMINGLKEQALLI